MNESVQAARLVFDAKDVIQICIGLIAVLSAYFLLKYKIEKNHGEIVTLRTAYELELRAAQDKARSLAEEIDRLRTSFEILNRGISGKLDDMNKGITEMNISVNKNISQISVAFAEFKAEIKSIK